MEKDKLDELIRESLMEEVHNIKMSSSLRENIRKNTMKSKLSLYGRFKRVMNTTIEIPVPSIMAACLLVFFIGFSTFRVTDTMKKDKSILGYTSVKVIKIGGADVYMDNGGGVNNGKSQN